VASSQLVGASAVSHNNAISLYPNPTNGAITARSGGAPLRAYSLYDLTGRELRRENGFHANEIPIYIENLPPGAYFVRLILADGTSVVKKAVKY